MNDYLWDKSGEPDADTEHLENLLGALKYEPRALELPRELPMPRKRQSFLQPRLAVAAALALMMLAGVIVTVLRQRDARDDSRFAVRTREAAPSQTDAKTTPVDKREAAETSHRATTTQRRAIDVARQSPDPSRQATTPDAGSESKTVSEVARSTRVAGVEEARGWRQRRAQQSSSSKHRQGLEAKESNARPSRTELATAAVPTVPTTRRSRRAVAADLAERQMAKAQLMLALRLTTDKLNLVQAKTNERARPAGGARPTSEEKNRIR